MAPVLRGLLEWPMAEDADGARTYRPRYLVESLTTDGPAAVRNTPGLPTPGSVWNVGTDFDLFAWRTRETDVRPLVTREPSRFWEVGLVFSTKPPKRCQDSKIEDPLLEPQRISGDFIRFTEEATFDRFGLPIVNSSWEQIRGPQVEFDANRPTIKIEQNVAQLQLPLLAAMNDTVNALPIWGMPPRTVKLTVGPWERKFYGSCSLYFTRSFSFEARWEGFDREVLDEGQKVLNGHWSTAGEWVLDPINGQPPNRWNPKHFKRAKDRAGENITIPLNGAGVPAGVTVIGSPTTIVVLVALANGALTIAAQPSATGQISVHVTDDNASIQGGTITITGTDEEGNTITEDIDIADGGSLEYVSARRYKTVTSIQVKELDGQEAADTVRVTTSAYSTNVGRILVSKYAESDFLLLGVPTDLSFTF